MPYAKENRPVKGTSTPGHGGARKGAGRKKGVKNTRSNLVQEAIILAAKAVGSDGKGKDELVGYLTARAKDQPAAFMQMITKVMPLQVLHQGDEDKPIQVTQIKMVAPGLPANDKSNEEPIVIDGDALLGETG